MEAKLLRQQVETVLDEQAGCRGRGRPPLLGETLLWGAMLVSIMEGDPSQRAIWRQVTSTGAWGQAPVVVGREAVRKRLVTTGPELMADLFGRVTALLTASHPGESGLAPFAAEVYALDASTLDAVAKRPSAGQDRPLAGRLHTCFDLRRQLFAQVVLTEDARVNERTTVPALLAGLPAGTLLVMDRGYVSFALFDTLVAAGMHLVTRYDQTFTVTHTLTDTTGVIDELGYCGIYRADQGGCLLRRITVPAPGGRQRTYLTSVTDPALLTPAAVARLYARRWDIEMAFKVLKRVLRLALIWSRSWPMNQLQVWATLVSFQIASSLRSEIARRAGVDIFDVSLEILLKDLPRYVARGDPDILGFLISRAPYGGIIRPHRRITITVPTDLPVTLPPADLPTSRPHRFAQKG